MQLKIFDNQNMFFKSNSLYRIVSDYPWFYKIKSIRKVVFETVVS